MSTLRGNKLSPRIDWRTQISKRKDAGTITSSLDSLSTTDLVVLEKVRKVEAGATLFKFHPNTLEGPHKHTRIKLPEKTCIYTYQTLAGRAGRADLASVDEHCVTMVEGPGVTLNGERLRKAGVIGQILIAVLGSALQPADLQSLLKLQVTDVVTLGKELFVFLAPLSSTSALAGIHTFVCIHAYIHGVSDADVISGGY